jgi:hypothetical protein
MKFAARAKHYSISTYIERSKCKGYHVWIFFEEQRVPAFKARLVVRHILDEIEEPDTEVFPKQDALGDNLRWGSFINAPMFGDLVPKGKTVFVDSSTFDPYPDQWSLLESVERVAEHDLDEIIEINSLSSPEMKSRSSSVDRGDGGLNRFSLPICAQKMLRDGVSQYQRDSCFRLAVHLKRLGLPYDLAVAALKTWALKNKPIDNKTVIQESGILSQTSCAYDRSYIGYGCESEAVRPYCDPSCPVKH